jgi:hypothetical protein
MFHQFGGGGKIKIRADKNIRCAILRVYLYTSSFLSWVLNPNIIC